MLKYKLIATYIISAIMIFLVFILDNSPIVTIGFNLFIFLIIVTLPKKSNYKIVFVSLILLYSIVNIITQNMISAESDNFERIVNLHYTRTYLLLGVLFSAITLFIEKNAYKSVAGFGFVFVLLIALQYVLSLDEVYLYFSSFTNIPMYLFPIGETSSNVNLIQSLIVLFKMAFVQIALLNDAKIRSYQRTSLNNKTAI
ncbi:MAG: hypothetical protein K9L26_00150 [Candidatus Izimaplasma sp.]|nr:hypothetical protein [Candidatus Izimaplasma bacterium]